MENKICEVKGQALIELCLILIVFIPLCIFGLHKIGVLGNQKLEKEKARFLKTKEKISENNQNFNFENLDEEEFEVIEELPHSFEKYEKGESFAVQLGEKIFYALEGGRYVEDASSYYKEQFLKQGWEVKGEMGWFIFEKEGEEAYLWQDEKNLFLFFY